MEHYKDFLIEYEPEWLYKAKYIKEVNDDLKLDFIWSINDIEEGLNTNLPDVIRKLRDKWIYTPISKTEYIEDLILLESFKDFINTSIIENLDLDDFTY